MYAVVRRPPWVSDRFSPSPEYALAWMSGSTPAGNVNDDDVEAYLHMNILWMPVWSKRKITSMRQMITTVHVRLRPV